MITVFGKVMNRNVFLLIACLVSMLPVWIILGKKKGFKLKNLLISLLLVIVGTIVGSVVIYALINYGDLTVFTDQIIKLKLGFVGYTVSKTMFSYGFLGAFLGSMLLLFYYFLFFTKEQRKAAFDIFGISVALFNVVCRIGWHFGGEYYGKAVKISTNVVGLKLNIPIALIEAYLYFLLFLLLLKYFNTNRFSGKINFTFLFFSSAISFVSEYIFGTAKTKDIYGFSILQIINAVIFLVSLGFFVSHPGSTLGDLFKKDNTTFVKKNIIKTIFLIIVTFGIYWIVVMTSVSKDVNKYITKHDQKYSMNYCALFFFFGIISLGIGYLVWYYSVTKRVANELSRQNIDYCFTKGDFWLWKILGIMVLIGPLVYLHKLFTALNLIAAENVKESLKIQNPEEVQ